MLLDFVSPSFFDVVPARSLWSRGRTLLRSLRDGEGFENRLDTVRRVLRDRAIEVRVVSPSDADRLEPGLETAEDRRARGQRVLEIYFAQLAGARGAALDLRRARFGRDGDTTRWQPRCLHVDWDDAFIRGLRDLYEGFYRDDEAQFRGAAENLGLTPALDLFRDHFGEGDQRAVRFQQDQFRRSFHAIFVRCREHGVELHPDFIALGVYLAALYEHLGSLDVELDVRSAFDRAWQR